MAAFLQDDGAGQGVIAPVPPDEGVGHMEVSDVFRMLDGDDLAQLPGVNDLLELGKEGVVAQHMADSDLPAPGLGLPGDLQALPGIRGDGLLQQNVVPQCQRLHHVAVVVLVHGGDDGRIGDVPLGEQILCPGEGHALGDMEDLGGMGQPVRPQLCHSSDLNAVGNGPIAVDHAPGTGADENIFHRNDLLFFLQYSTALWF